MAKENFCIAYPDTLRECLLYEYTVGAVLVGDDGDGGEDTRSRKKCEGRIPTPKRSLPLTPPPLSSFLLFTVGNPVVIENFFSNIKTTFNDLFSHVRFIRIRLIYV